LRLRSDELNPVVELYSKEDFRQEAVAFEAASALLSSLRELEDHRQRGFVGEATLRSGRAMANGGKRAFDRVCGPRVFPMLGGKVVEGEQRVTIFGKALGCFFAFAAVGLDEDVESGFGGAPCLRHPDVVQRTLNLAVQAVGQLVEHVGGLVHPTTLRSRVRQIYSIAFQKPSAPSPTASCGPLASPRRFRSSKRSPQDCALSRRPSASPTSSFLPSGVAPMITSRHCASSSSRACT
jgi:hypothetical protein